MAAPESVSKPPPEIGIEIPAVRSPSAAKADMRAFFKNLRASLPDELPDVQVEFEDVTYTARVPLQEAGFSTVGSVFRNLLPPYKARTRSKAILSKCNGVLEPGTLTLLLGPSGHGKSTLLKILSGRIAPGEFDGHVWYGGKSAEEVNVNRLVTYVDQRDNHVPLLTVEETMKFSLYCMEDPLLMKTADAVPGATPKDIAGKVANIIKIFGLSNAAKTIVGDNLIRGVSGGEKKRVTLAEMMMGNARVLLLDDISTGLDSSTTKDIVEALKAAAQELNVAVLVTLLQPPPEVYALFDRIMLMREGRLVYHGPLGVVAEYFANMGMPCPDDADPADFYVDFLSDPELVWDRHVKRLRHERGDAEYVPDIIPPLSTDDLVLHFHAFMHHREWGMFTTAGSGKSGRTSPAQIPEATPLPDEEREFKAMPTRTSTVEIATGASRSAKHVLGTYGVTKKSSMITLDDPVAKRMFADTYALSSWQQFKAVFGREVRLMSRNKQFVRSHIINDIFMGLVVGSLFWNLNPDSFQIRYGLFFLAMVHVMFSGLAEVPLIFNMKRVVNKHRLGRFYSITSYVLAVTIVSLPLAMLDSVIFSSIVYWMSNFDQDFARFLFFILIVFLVGITFNSFFRFIAVIAPSMDLSQAASAPVSGLVVMFAGFLVTRNKILIWLQWVYWISPFSWSIRSVALNEFNAPRYDNIIQDPQGNPIRAGTFYLEAYETQTDFKWKWLGVAYLCGVFVLTVIWVILALRYLVRDDIRMVPYIDDPDKKTAPTRRRRMVWDDEEGKEQEVTGGRPPSSASVNLNGLRKVNVAPASSREEMAVVPTPAPAPAAAGGHDVSLLVGTMQHVQPVTLVFNNMSYDVPVAGGTRRLLQGVTGYALPGTLTALMGASGAGKTTLLDVISGRKTGGKITGDILVNGKPKDPEMFPRITGYVEQADIHDPHTTVREGLLFSAKLRMAKQLPEAELNLFINDLIHVLELDHVADWLVGSEETGIPRGERKRFTIGVELVTNPSVLFLDEPTSGLDSREAASVMRVVHRIAKSGRTVIATIHQPAAELFFAFDQLLLLRRGGETVYFGSIRDRAKPMVRYLEDISGAKLPLRTNPANWMLDVLNKTAPGCRKDVDYAELYRNGPLAKSAADDVARMTADAMAAPQDPTEWRVNLTPYQQFKIVFLRTANDYWRDLYYNMARFVAVVALGVFLGVVFYNLPVDSLAGVQSRISSLYMVGLFIGIIFINTSIGPAFQVRAAFYREQAARAYSPWAYSLSLAIIEIPYTIAITLPGGVIFYFMANMKQDFETWVQYQLSLAAGALAFNCLGHVLAAMVATAETAMIFVGGVFTLTNIFCGLYIPRPQIPRGWIWMYWINPAAHMAQAFVTPQFYCDNSNGGCPTLSYNGNSFTVSDYVEDFLGHQYSQRWLLTLSTFLLSIGFRIIAMFALRYINHLKR